MNCRSSRTRGAARPRRFSCAAWFARVCGRASARVPTRQRLPRTSVTVADASSAGASTMAAPLIHLPLQFAHPGAVARAGAASGAHHFTPGSRASAWHSTTRMCSKTISLRHIASMAFQHEKGRYRAASDRSMDLLVSLDLAAVHHVPRSLTERIAPMQHGEIVPRQQIADPSIHSASSSASLGKLVPGHVRVRPPATWREASSCRASAATTR